MFHIYTWALLRLEEDNGSSRTGIIGRSQVTKNIILNDPWNLKGFRGNPMFERTVKRRDSVRRRQLTSVLLGVLICRDTQREGV